MSRRSQRNTYLRHIAMLIAIPLVLMGTGYALFSQKLGISSTLIKPAYSMGQNILMTYASSSVQSGQNWTHTVSPMTVKNNGTTGVTAWQVLFTIPAGSSQLTCSGTVNCSLNGTQVTITNGTGNGNLNATASTQFTVSFRAPIQNYSLQNIATSGSAVLSYQNMPGLTATNTVGTRTKSGKWYAWPYTFTVTNNSGQTISAWRIVAGWDTATNQVNSMPIAVSYTTTATNLTMIRAATMPSGTNYVFSANLGSTNANWNIGAYTIQGAL